MAFFFPIFFNKYYSAGRDPGWTTLQLGFANAFASLLLAGATPYLGALSDQSGSKKSWLLGFTIFGILATAALTFGPGRVAVGDRLLCAWLNRLLGYQLFL